jgi:hypothetical protein
MKKKSIILFLTVATTFSAAAQSGGSSYQKGDILINAGIGLGGLYWGTGYGFPVSIGASGEYGITENISVGGGLSFSSVTYRFSNVNYGYNAVSFSGRGAYHFLTQEKLDPYAGLSLGFVNVVEKEKNAGLIGARGGGVIWGAFAGARYYFSPKFGAYAELGATSLAVLNLGVTFKL